MNLHLARAVAIAGTALVVYGAWMAWPPAGFVSAGVALVMVGAGAAK